MQWDLGPEALLVLAGLSFDEVLITGLLGVGVLFAVRRYARRRHRLGSVNG